MNDLEDSVGNLTSNLGNRAQFMTLLWP